MTEDNKGVCDIVQNLVLDANGILRVSGWIKNKNQIIFFSLCRLGRPRQSLEELPLRLSQLRWAHV